MISSRLDTTKKLVESLNRFEKKDKLFISTSAVGIYDNKAKYDENGSFSNDFLSTLCQNWEKEAQKAKSESTKVAIFRFGIDRKSTRLNSSHLKLSRMPSSA